ncbi:hypothetical protein PENSUB_652 [Penicillium subrubescens]|jgi:hypothetical protein|uniref:Uncharacterized protein n=2 Tax=Penicillium subrubescens TaxID=1316194 RepID=A0A1Q5ULX1_9EURO|nr:hypothetical protein PENSUB_652 [Penicillium subrubescens]
MGKSRNSQRPEIAGGKPNSHIQYPVLDHGVLPFWVCNPPKTIHIASTFGTWFPHIQIVVQIVVPHWLRPGMALSAEWMPMQRFAEVSPIRTAGLHGVAPTRVVDA